MCVLRFVRVAIEYLSLSQNLGIHGISSADLLHGYYCFKPVSQGSENIAGGLQPHAMLWGGVSGALMSIMPVDVHGDSWAWLENPHTERCKLASPMQARCTMAACFTTPTIIQSITFLLCISRGLSLSLLLSAAVLLLPKCAVTEKMVVAGVASMPVPASSFVSLRPKATSSRA